MEEEAESLFQFAQCIGLCLPEEVRKKIETSLPKKSGAEHKVFFNAHSKEGRVIKITFPGKYGRWEHTPFLYLERWELLEAMAPVISMKFEGCIKTPTKEISIITSMQFFKGPHPSGEEADAFVKSLGFKPLSYGTTTLDYIDQKRGLILRDCHPGNWIKSSQTLVPIDIIPEKI
jgi:hypothetical protein